MSFFFLFRFDQKKSFSKSCELEMNLFRIFFASVKGFIEYHFKTFYKGIKSLMALLGSFVPIFLFCFFILVVTSATRSNKCMNTHFEYQKLRNLLWKHFVWKLYIKYHRLKIYRRNHKNRDSELKFNVGKYIYSKKSLI